MGAIEVRPLAPALGAEIFGVDLSRPLEAATVAAVRRALLDHLVIFFRDQVLTPPQQAAFGRCFGPLSIHSHIKPVPEDESVIAIIKEEGDTRNVGARWHTDETYKERTSLGSILYAREVPDVGGDTMFANMYLAFEALSPGMQRMLLNLRAVNTGPRIYNTAFADTAGADNYAKIKSAAAEKLLSAVHPVVRTHPETGRKALFVNTSHTMRFEDMTEEESVPLLQFLLRHAARPEFTCRFRWRVGSIAFWDNRCTQHIALNDYPGKRRVMHRVTVEGDRPE